MYRCLALSAQHLSKSAQNRIMRLLLPIGFGLMLMLAIFPKIARGQSVTIHLFQPPPNELKAADLWVVALTNATKNSYPVYIHATGYEVSNPSNPILVVDARTANFTLPPGFHMVTGANISPVTVNSSNSTYRSIVTTTGQVPAGNYHVCDTLIEAKTGAILGFDCIDQQVDVANPPVLIMPADGSTVPDKFPLFSWIAPSPLVGLNAVYTLKIVELYGQQTPYDAIQSNPAYFLASSISRTIFQYPLSSQQFMAGRQYAWQITAVSSGNSAQIPLGSSEVWEFSYDPNGLNGGDLGSGVGDGTGSNGNGSSGSGNAVGSLDMGKYSDSATLYNNLLDYFQDNFFIPAGYNNLVPGGIESSASLDSYNDPNAYNFVPNTSNDSSSTSACGRPPSVTLAIQNPPFDQNAVNWHQPFGMTWSVRHSAPVDHIDLQIALFGHEDAPLAHFIYRTASGSVPTATSFDPRPYILNPDAEGMICVVTAVAVDVLGRSSGAVQKLYINGSFPAIPHLAPLGMVDDIDIGFRATDSIIIAPNGAANARRVMLHRMHGVSGETLVLTNQDAAPHHFRSSYTPPYSESIPLTVGGVQVLDFGEVMPGMSSSVTVPESVPDCYLWTLYDLETMRGAEMNAAALNVEIGHGDSH